MAERTSEQERLVAYPPIRNWEVERVKVTEDYKRMGKSIPCRSVSTDQQAGIRCIAEFMRGTTKTVADRKQSLAAVRADMHLGDQMHAGRRHHTKQGNYTFATTHAVENFKLCTLLNKPSCAQTHWVWSNRSLELCY